MDFFKKKETPDYKAKQRKAKRRFSLRFEFGWETSTRKWSKFLHERKARDRMIEKQFYNQIKNHLPSKLSIFQASKPSFIQKDRTSCSKPWNKRETQWCIIWKREELEKRNRSNVKEKSIKENLLQKQNDAKGCRQSQMENEKGEGHVYLLACFGLFCFRAKTTEVCL